MDSTTPLVAMPASTRWSCGRPAPGRPTIPDPAAILRPLGEAGGAEEVAAVIAFWRELGLPGLTERRAALSASGAGRRAGWLDVGQMFWQSSGRKKMLGAPFLRMLLLVPWCRFRYQALAGIGEVTPDTVRVWFTIWPVLSAVKSISMYKTPPWLWQLPVWMCAACIPGLTPLALTVTVRVWAVGL